MIDPIGRVSPLPLEIKRIVFLKAKGNLHNFALVCKVWKELADDKIFREIIRPAKAFGSREWREYIGVDIEEEPPLPRCSYCEMEREEYYLTFIPKTIKMKTEKNDMNNEENEEIQLNSLKNIGKLISKSKKGNKTGYSPQSFCVAIEEERKLENSHWVLINKKLKCKGIY